MSGDGVTEKLLRDRLDFVTRAYFAERKRGNDAGAPELPPVRSEPEVPSKTQAEKEISKIAERIHDAENQIQGCHDKLGTNLNGDDMATVRITLTQALKELKACREAELE